MSGAAAARAPRIICAEASMRFVAHTFRHGRALHPAAVQSYWQTGFLAPEWAPRASKGSRTTTGTESLLWLTSRHELANMTASALCGG
jgi:hypothetical protein